MTIKEFIKNEEKKNTKVGIMLREYYKEWLDERKSKYVHEIMREKVKTLITALWITDYITEELHDELYTDFWNIDFNHTDN